MDTIDINLIRVFRILAEGSTELVINLIIADIIYNSIELIESNGFQLSFHLNKWDFDDADMEYQTLISELTRIEKTELLHQLENLL